MGSTLGLIRRSSVGGAFKNIDTQNTNGTRCTHCGNFGTYANTGASYAARGCKENCIILGHNGIMGIIIYLDIYGKKILYIIKM